MTEPRLRTLAYAGIIGWQVPAALVLAAAGGEWFAMWQRSRLERARQRRRLHPILDGIVLLVLLAPNGPGWASGGALVDRARACSYIRR